MRIHVDPDPQPCFVLKCVLPSFTRAYLGYFYSFLSPPPDAGCQLQQVSGGDDVPRGLQAASPGLGHAHPFRRGRPGGSRGQPRPTAQMDDPAVLRDQPERQHQRPRVSGPRLPAAGRAERGHRTPRH